MLSCDEEFPNVLFATNDVKISVAFWIRDDVTLLESIVLLERFDAVILEFTTVLFCTVDDCIDELMIVEGFTKELVIDVLLILPPCVVVSWRFEAVIKL